MLNSPNNGKINQVAQPLSFLPSTDAEGEWILWEIRNREKLILEIGGEKVKLLKRKWDGANKCVVCWDDVRKQGENDCEACYGTGVTGGYYEPIEIWVSLVNPAIGKIELFDHGMRTTIQPRSWTIYEPVLQNKDILISKQHEKRYWVNDVTTSLFRGLPLRQSMDLELIESTNVIYKFPIEGM